MNRYVRKVAGLLLFLGGLFVAHQVIQAQATPQGLGFCWGTCENGKKCANECSCRSNKCTA